MQSGQRPLPDHPQRAPDWKPGDLSSHATCLRQAIHMSLNFSFSSLRVEAVVRAFLAELQRRAPLRDRAGLRLTGHSLGSCSPAP